MSLHFIGPEPIIPSELYEMSTVEECLAYFADKEFIQVDTETQGRSPFTKKILSLQLGTDERQYVIDVRYIDILQFKELLESKDKRFILHNAKFDYKFLKHAGIVLENIWDTMLAECVLYCGYKEWGYSLLAVAKRYLDVDLDKTTRGDFYKLEGQPFSDKQIEYAALDVAYLYKIAKKQRLKAIQYDVLYAIELENSVVKAVADIEYNGMYLDRDAWLKNAEEHAVLQKDIHKELDEIVTNEPKLAKYVPNYVQGNLFGYEERALNINYSSPSQISKLFDDLGYPVESTSDGVLRKYVNKHSFFAALQRYRKTSKIVSTYGKSFLKAINKTTGRVHTEFWQVLNTFRMSSGGGKDRPDLPNLQNIPASDKFRNCFKPREGYKWLSIDYAAQELRLMADASDEEGFIDVLNRGEDLHCYVGSMMTGKTITKEDKAERTAAKTINFGKPYGMGPNKLADTLEIDVEKAEDLFKQYAKAFPKLNAWLEGRSKFAKTNGYIPLANPHKGRRWFPTLPEAQRLRAENNPNWREIFKIEGSVEREGSNTPIQGTGAAIMKEALVETREIIKNYDAYLICTVHDQLDIEVREDQAEELSRVVSEAMVKCGNKYVTKVNMEVDATITDMWQK
jgi:DNA polymerase I-like protein with 3'-5' exonuclease and polymerase domains